MPPVGDSVTQKFAGECNSCKQRPGQSKCQAKGGIEKTRKRYAITQRGSSVETELVHERTISLVKQAHFPHSVITPN